MAGQADHALLIDTRAAADAVLRVAGGAAPPQAAAAAAGRIAGVVPVPLNDPAVRVVVIDSKQRHFLAAGEDAWYPQRVAQCAAAVDAITAVREQHFQRAAAEAATQIEHAAPLRSLRDCTLEMLLATGAGGADPPLWFRRARHVLSENQRTLDGAQALKGKDWAKFGELMAASHASLRKDYEVSTERLDWLVAAASALDGVFGARLTGAGFGGCVVALVREEAVEALRAGITQGYSQMFGVEPDVFVTRPGGGARTIVQ